MLSINWCRTRTTFLSTVYVYNRNNSSSQIIKSITNILVSVPLQLTINIHHYQYKLIVFCFSDIMLWSLLTICLLILYRFFIILQFLMNLIDLPPIRHIFSCTVQWSRLNFFLWKCQVSQRNAIKYEIFETKPVILQPFSEWKVFLFLFGIGYRSKSGACKSNELSSSKQRDQIVDLFWRIKINFGLIMMTLTIRIDSFLFSWRCFYRKNEYFPTIRTM